MLTNKLKRGTDLAESHNTATRDAAAVVGTLTLCAQFPPSAADTPSIANTMLIGMVASAMDLEHSAGVWKITGRQCPHGEMGSYNRETGGAMCETAVVRRVPMKSTAEPSSTSLNAYSH